MFSKNFLFARAMGCCGCFGFGRRPQLSSHTSQMDSRDYLLDEEIEDEDDFSYNGEVTNTAHGDDSEFQSHAKHPEEILKFREQNGLICRKYPVKETNTLIRAEASIELKWLLSQKHLMA